MKRTGCGIISSTQSIPAPFGQDSVTTPNQQPALSFSSTFAAFRHRNYRLWFIGQLVSLVGTWMQSTAQGYLVFTLTGSVAYLGYVGFIAGIPSWLLMLYGGLIADRISRRTMLILTQCAQMVLAFVLAGLVIFELVQPWHILVLSFLLGITNAFDTPARQSFVVELVDRADVTNAIALNGTMFNAGAIVGPAAAGAVYALAGPAWCFTINGISFIAVIVALVMMRIDETPTPARSASALAAIREAFQYVRADRLTSTLVISVFYLTVFGFGLVTLVPAWAVNVLGGDVTTNGLMLSARGAGAVVGGLSIAAFAGYGLRGKMWSISSLLLPAFFLGFAFSRSLPLSLLMLVGTGFSLISIMNNSNAMVQSRVPDGLRGRVMGLYSLMFMGGGPVGALLIGLVAEGAGEMLTVLMCVVMLFLFAFFIWFFRPEIRGMK